MWKYLKVLHIYGAYYGIQWPTSENSCIQTRRDVEMPAVCFFPSTLDKLLTRCESNSSCLVEINRVAFGDPCPTYTKQFFVQYQCIERTELTRIHASCPAPKSKQHLDDMSYICSGRGSELGEGEQEKTWCSHDPTMHIRCDSPGKTLEILCAFYGLNHKLATHCNVHNVNNAPVCYFHSSFDTVKVACENRTECELSNFKHTFADPCRGFDKALYVRWRCV